MSTDTFRTLTLIERAFLQDVLEEELEHLVRKIRRQAWEQLKEMLERCDLWEDKVKCNLSLNFEADLGLILRIRALLLDPEEDAE